MSNFLSILLAELTAGGCNCNPQCTCGEACQCTDGCTCGGACDCAI